MMNSKHLCHLFILIICLFLNNVAANKKLRKIILASLISKSLKSHMGGHPSIVPIVMPPFKSNDKHQDTGHTAQTNHDQTYQNSHNSHTAVQAHVPTITVHHYHHHTTSHHLAEPVYAKYDDDSYGDHHFDGSYNNLIEPDYHQTSHFYNTHDDFNSGKIKHFHIGNAANSLLSGALGGQIGNIASGHIGGQIG